MIGEGLLLLAIAVPGLLICLTWRWPISPCGVIRPRPLAC